MSSANADDAQHFGCALKGQESIAQDISASYTILRFLVLYFPMLRVDARREEVGAGYR